MSTGKFAALIRVRPAPTTIAASSAVLKHLKKQGRIITFIRKPEQQVQNDEACYYTIFSHEPPSLSTEFAVSVYHDLPTPRDVDPFNIRGMLNRKPNPDPIELQCKLDVVPKQEMHQQKDWIDEQSHYRGGYFTDYKNQRPELQSLYHNIGAPPGVARSVGDWNRAPGKMPASPPAPREDAKIRKLKMNALMESWREARTRREEDEGKHE